VAATDPESGILVAPIALGGQPIGSLALSEATLTDGAMQALLNLVAISLERVRTQESSNRAAAAQRAEEFKSTLLDAIAHEFKTPLTSIRAASTAMLSGPAPLGPETAELAAIIDEESQRLNQLVSEAVRMAELDAGKVRLERRPVTLAGVVDLALGQFPAAREERRFGVEIEPAAAAPVLADADLLALALRQLIDNSLKYAPPGTPVTLRGSASGASLELRVSDRGPGIPASERERIFGKYYRREAARRQAPGSGMGLHIAREILRAHGGDLTSEDTLGGGAQFCMTIPRGGDGAL